MEEKETVAFVNFDNVANNYITRPTLEKYYKRAKAQTKRRFIANRDNPEDNEVRNLIEAIFGYIVNFNSLDEDTTIINNHPLSDWPVLNEFKDLILPNSVRWKSGDKSYNDVLVRVTHKDFVDTKKGIYKKIDVSKLDYLDYLDKLSQFRSLFKKDASSDYVSLESLRVDKSVTDVIDYVVIEDGTSKRCHYDTTPFIPVIKLKLDNSIYSTLFKDWHYSADVDEVVDVFVSKLFF